jgi:cyclic pyranopterin phosphate synthase
MITDNLDRQFETLRLSLTDNCNLSCLYCDPSTNNKLSNNKPLPYKQYVNAISEIHKITKLKTVRLTGGEPTLYPDIIPLIYAIKQLGIKKVSITTNAIKLANIIPELKKAGIDSINISMDAIDHSTFLEITKKDYLNKVLSGIECTINNSISIKINCTVIKNLNENQIIPILKYANKNKIVVRFLEVMQMGHLFNDFNNYLFPKQEILNTISKEYSFTELKRHKSSTATYYLTNNNITFGIIANYSSPFCHDCNRLRMDKQGVLYGCLSSKIGFPVLSTINQPDVLKSLLTKALYQKQEDKFVGSSLSMKAIGG